MSVRQDKLLICDMIEACNRIILYTKNIDSSEELCKQSIVADATIRNIEILGEASAKVSQTIKERFNNIPWREITATRNVLIHEYFGIDFDTLYKIVKDDIPKLYRDLKAICKAEGWECE